MSTASPLAPAAPAPAPAAKVRARDLPAGLKTYLARYWVGKLDMRPFAFYRMAVGIFLFYDLCDFFPGMRTFFSDEGVLPRTPFLGQWARQWRFSLLDSFGPPALTYVFWFFSAACVLAMAVGYRTRLASFLSFLCLASFQERLPPLFDGSDTVIRMCLFWHMFCPTGNAWSVDALLAERRGQPLPKIVGALPFRILQLQVAWIYLCTFAHKIQGNTWRNGDAVHYTVHLNHVFSRPWAATTIADIAPLMALATWGTLVFEAGFLFLVYLPSPSAKLFKWVKAFAILSIVSMHVGIMFTINVGNFSYLMPLTLTMFWEPEWIDWLVNKIVSKLGPSRMERIRELALKFPEFRVVEAPAGGWFSARTKERFTNWGGVALVLWFIACTWYATPPYIRTWTGQQLTVVSRALGQGGVNPMPHWIETPVQALDVWSSWDMFSPEPLRTDYHLTAPGELEDGTPVNLFGSDAGEQRGFWFTRWFKYFENVTGGDKLLPLEWGRYMCRERNFNLGPGEKRLYTFTLYKENQIIPPIGQPWPPVTKDQVWVHRCFDKPSENKVSPANPLPGPIATPAPLPPRQNQPALAP
ncbi:MAG: HTTM domain-containing protein [Deltaproteobacteria bacterium]|nr:HTTM domain-containing protein [Deltaproteobacteria bacterium]